MAISPFPILMMVLLGPSGVGSDLVSLVDANAYFQAHNITVTTDKLVELATKDPVDGKTQIAQLLALRQLAVDAAKIKKAKNYQEILKKIENVAQGKTAQDPEGFAAEYARMTAKALGSDKVRPLVRLMPENSARQDAFTWFPQSVKFVAAVDFRGDQPLTAGAGKALRELYAQFVPLQAWDEVFKVVDKLGNVRIDRFAIGYTPAAGKDDEGRIYMRISGKGDPKRLIAVFKEADKRIVVKEQKGFRGQRVTLLQFPGSGSDAPTVALIGDSDLIVAGFEGHKRWNNEQPPEKRPDLAEEMLAVRAGRAKNVLAGPLNALLKKLSPKAAGVAAGEIPEETRRELMRPPAFAVFPKEMRAEMIRGKKQTTLTWYTRLDNAKEAAKFVAEVARLKKMGIDELKETQMKLPPGLPIPAKTFEELTKLLESIKSEAKGSKVQGSLTLPAESIRILGTLGMVGAVPAPAAPPPKGKIEKRDTTKKKALNSSALPFPQRGLAWAAPPAELTRPRQAIACLHEYAARRGAELSASHQPQTH